MVPMLQCGFVLSNLAFAILNVLLNNLRLYGISLIFFISGYLDYISNLRYLQAYLLFDLQLISLSHSRDFLLYGLRNLLIFLEEHGVVTTSLSLGTKVGGISEHLSQRNICLYDLTAAEIIHTLDTATTGVDITDDIAHVFLRHGNLYLHDRLKQYRSCPSALLP